MTRWWNGSVGYEIYPRSFADSNDDGIGDLEGIRQRLPYLEWLGVDAIWLAPFYDSPGFDHGYDVADYKGINAIHGDFADFHALVAAAHERAIKIIVDIVPNHSSSHHVWFQEATKSRDNPYRDYYIWKDPGPAGGPPNNWVSHFGGPAWTFHEPTGQYYCHLFLPEQPDLNWANPAVRGEFESILRFWCDRGVDGFRIDVAHALMKDPEFRDNPKKAVDATGSDPGPTPELMPDLGDPAAVFGSFDHLHDVDQDSTIEIYQRWNEVVAPYDAVLIGESNPRTLDRVERYVHGDALHTIFFLEPAWMGWKPAQLLADIETVHKTTDTGLSWVLDNHDTARSPSRFGGGDKGRRRSLALMTFMMALGGFPFLWEGQELGLDNAKLRFEDLEDPVSTRNEHAKGRDVTRTVMPWDSSHANGFCATAQPWLHAPERPIHETVAGQSDDPASWLNRHRELLRVRKAMPDLWQAAPQWIDGTGATTRIVRRGSALAIANLGESAAAVSLPPGQWLVRFDSANGIGQLTVEEKIELARESTLVLEET